MRVSSREGRRAALDRHAMAALQRVLIVTDGTVTPLLEDWLDESLVARRVPAPARAPETALSSLASREADVELRAVLLCGGRTDKPYLYGESVLVSERLPNRLLASLRDTDVPLGRLVRQARLATFREVVDAWREPADALASDFGLAPDAELFARVYRVDFGRGPAALITEKFPSDFFRDGWRP